MAKEKIQFELNGQQVTLGVEPDELLIDVLRDHLGLKGTKAGCRAGECGSCSVILNGRVVTSCLVPAMKADGGKITTVEGLEKEGELHPLQKAFVENGAIQCGFCTPGMLLSAKNLLDENPHPTMEEIKVAISGVLCRCTGYRKIIHAIHSVTETQ
jgi:aerobic-type carbon monoxide dehydrogenase small subunit (CoxS/CutS family)